MAKIRKSVTMSDIAERLNVSTVTVSKALAGHKGVSEEMREKIRSLAEEMGYKTVSGAKDKEEKAGYNIGILLPGRYLASYISFYWKMYQEVADIAIQQECFSLFEIISEEMEQSKQKPRLLEENKVDGLIIIGKPGYEYDLFLKSVCDKPIVFLDFYDADSEVDCVISDGFYGTYVLTNYLINKGHTDIAYVGTLFSTESITDRYLGYKKALMEHRIPELPDHVIEDRDEISGMRDNYEDLKFPEKMPSAFICNCDFIASLVIKALEDKGYRIPEDVSIVGYDNYLFPGLSDVEITTYEVDIREMAKCAIDVMLQKISGAEYRKGIHIVEGHLVEKQSVAERNA